MHAYIYILEHELTSSGGGSETLAMFFKENAGAKYEGFLAQSKSCIWRVGVVGES